MSLMKWSCKLQIINLYFLLNSGQLIHADKHGFLVIPEEDEEKLLEASDYMDMMERKLVLVPGREGMFAFFKHFFMDFLRFYSWSLFWFLLITEGAPSRLQRNSCVAFGNHLFGIPTIFVKNFKKCHVKFHFI